MGKLFIVTSWGSNLYLKGDEDTEKVKVHDALKTRGFDTEAEAKEFCEYVKSLPSFDAKLMTLTISEHAVA